MEFKIAVLLPVYRKDSADYFHLAMQSVASQDGAYVYVGVDGPIEGLISDEVKHWEEKDNVRVVYFSENRGLACVLNDLVDMAIADGFEYLARMDADDISLPDRFAKQVAFLEEHPEVDVIGGAIEEIDGDGRSRNKAIFYPDTHEACRRFFAKRDPHAHPAVMFRKSYFEKCQDKYRPTHRRNQDMMLWCDGMVVGTIHANLPDVVLKFRMADELFKKRRGGWKYANQQLQDRLEVNRTLHYGLGSYLTAYATFVMQLSPAWVKKLAYRIFR